MNPGPGNPFDYCGAIRGCAEGDRTALRAIYDRDAGLMLGIANRILRRRELAEEAVQDAFVQIWTKASSFDPGRGAPRAWLFAIVRNRALNILRDGAREELTDAVPEAADDAPGPEAIVSSLSDAGRLRRCLETIEAKRRDCLLLSYAHGLSHGEVAGRLGLPLGTVKAWIRRSLLSLRECMQ
jgi:RNA polymerase sigma factor (sigma-70 family)